MVGKISKVFVLALALPGLFGCAQLTRSPGDVLGDAGISNPANPGSLKISASIAVSTRRNDTSTIGLYKFFDTLPVAVAIENGNNNTFILSREDIVLKTDYLDYRPMSSEQIRRLLSTKWIGIPKSVVFRDLERGYARWAADNVEIIEPFTTRIFYVFYLIDNAERFDKTLESHAFELRLTEINEGYSYVISD